ncbi:MAG: carotenoid biosynthesis protein [Nitrospirae bacterium]|jgi:putative membrane protein|nr:carotenoid biosynthesis protein [Nitrospirota bacterium]
MHLLISTILFRWYVFLFWGAGLVLLARQTGWIPALIRFVLAYLIAYVSEDISSLPGGWFPFGHYTYLPTTRDQEIWIGHLPLMDSLSFAFLMVASLGTVARFRGTNIRVCLTGPFDRTKAGLWARAVIVFVLIDVVIDPVSLRGNRWFLGQIYYYPEGGAYFGVPFANFAGWAIVGTLILIAWGFPFSETGCPREGGTSLQRRTIDSGIDRWGPVALYSSVFLFNASIAFYLREWALGMADLCVGLLASLAGVCCRKAPEA